MAFRELIVGLTDGLRKRIRPQEEGFEVVYERQDPTALFPDQWNPFDRQSIAADAPDAQLFHEVSALFGVPTQ